MEIRQSIKQWLSSLKVSQKIGLGYAIALGIAVSGTIAGFGVGYYSQQQARHQENHARNEVELLHRLQSRVLQTRTHQQQLIPLVSNPDKFQDEYAHLQKHKAEIQEIWAELKAFIVAYPNLDSHAHQTTIPAFLQTYDSVPQRYSQVLERRVAQIGNLDLASFYDVEQARSLLLEFTNSDLALKFDGISDDLVSLIDEAYQELEVASQLEEQARENAESIVVLSIILSVAIAILLAILTSRVITQPIQTLTNIAIESTEKSNFNLQATIQQNDEIGTLAHAFNKLIYSVKQLLQQQKIDQKKLKIYSQTLEYKVEERTQELNEKNMELQHLLEELQRTQVQMVHSEKMAALGQMVAGVAHEINNPVSFIHGNLTHLQEYTQNLLEYVQLYQKFDPDPLPEIQTEAEELDIEFIQEDLPKVLNSMEIGTDRIRQIVLSLRNFSRIDEAEFKTVDLHEGIESTLLILQHRLTQRPNRPEIKVIRDYGSLPPVNCYPGQMNQVFMNILTNAIDALEEANIKRTDHEIQDNPNQITIRTSRIDSNWVKITISDNGMGMYESVQKRIFDPFFTTKSVGKGTGMGMPISYKIITEKHGGQLKFTSRPGKGTKFIIKIPVQQSIQ